MPISPSLLERFTAAENSADALDLLAEHTDELLNDESLASLDQMIALTDDPAQQDRLRERRTLIAQLKALAELPDDEKRFMLFTNIQDHAAMLAFAAGQNDADLDALERTAEAHLVSVQGDEAAAIRQRLDDLRRLRVGELPAARALAERVAQMSDDERLLLAFEMASGPADIMGLVGRTSDDDLNALERAAQAKLANADGDDAAGLRRRLDDLHTWRAAEQQARRTLAPLGEEGGQAVANRLIAWIQTPDWDASQEFIATHAAELLSEQGAAALTLLRLRNPGNEQIELHVNLLAACQRTGIGAAYAQLHNEQEVGRQLADSPLLAAVAGFLTTESDDAAQRMLAEEGAMLLTAEARALLEQFQIAARQQADANAQQRIAVRLALWQTAWNKRAGSPLRRPATHADTDERQPEARSTQMQDQQRQPDSAERTAKYHIVTAINSVIGENNTVFNIYNVGELRLHWQRPSQRWNRRIRGAVGREEELAELHTRLTSGGSVALISKGASAALRGQPGIGKSVLADMYVERYGAGYEGGVIWLDIGPAARYAFHMTPHLQQLAALAYEDPLQAAKMLENCELAPEVVAALLARHGPLLVVADDLWSEEALAALKAALPAECSLLLTTRDYDVAFSLEEREEAILQLDVLRKEDARALLQSKVSGLADDLADRLAAGLGRHAQALALAAGALLARRRAQPYAKTVDEILQRVAAGRGFGDLPRLDKAERLSKVEVALSYSYDYLGEGVGGANRQAWLRALGVFAQEADFDLAAAAAVWALDGDAAREVLLLLDGLALIQATGEAGALSGGRWQQHAILRAYALSLQDEEERLVLPQRHADYYLDLTTTVALQ